MKQTIETLINEEALLLAKFFCSSSILVQTSVIAGKFVSVGN